jgi:hypothetical protein
MCYKCENPEMAGLHQGHLPLLLEAAPSVTRVTRDVYWAMTKDLNPHLPALIAFVAMAEALQNNDFGVLREHRLVRLPLSIIGTDKVRYRTQVVGWLHEAILSLRMSNLTMETIRTVLYPHHLCILFLCSCGVVMGRCANVRAYYGSEGHRRMDRLRSAIDKSGSPVVPVQSFDDIKVPTMDMHPNGAEARLFARIEVLTRLAAQAGHQDYPWLYDELKYFIQHTRQPLLAAA